MKLTLFLAVSLALVVTASAMPTRAADKIQLDALIASNAQHAFTEIIKDYESKHPNVEVKAQWLGGATIAKMVDEGKPADVAMAGSTILKRKESLLDKPIDILQNKEVILVPKGNPGKITGLKDLANPGVSSRSARRHRRLGQSRVKLSKRARPSGDSTSSRTFVRTSSSRKTKAAMCWPRSAQKPTRRSRSHPMSIHRSIKRLRSMTSTTLFRRIKSPSSKRPRTPRQRRTLPTLLRVR